MSEYGNRKKFLHVYFLRDPTTNLVKYIGSSSDPEKRARQHYATKCRNSTLAARRWMLSLGKQRPILQVVTHLIPRKRALQMENRLQVMFHKKRPGQIVNGTSYRMFQDDCGLREVNKNCVYLYDCDKKYEPPTREQVQKWVANP